MGKEAFEIDTFLDELKLDLEEPNPHDTSDEAMALEKETVEVIKPIETTPLMGNKDTSDEKSISSILGRSALVLLETVLLVLVALYGILYVLAKGPSPTARDILVMSVRETSAIGFIADIFFTEEEIAQIENAKSVEEYVQTDTSLINIQKPQENAPEATGPVADEWGLVDEDGDGIIIEEVHGEGYSGYMMIVLDPSRVVLGTQPYAYGGRGYTVAEMVAGLDAVAGINAGGFEAPEGKGNGSVPNSMVVYEGKIYYDYKAYK